MSLKVYLSKEEIPNGISVITKNDDYFDVNTLLDASDNFILQNIDGAVYNSENTFIGRDSSLGALYRENLSSGCKTALNVIHNTDKCFSTIECGNNASDVILQLQEGQALWVKRSIMLKLDTKVDIVYRNKKCKSIKEFINALEDSDE